VSAEATEFKPFFKPEHWGHTVGHLFLEPIGSRTDRLEVDEERGRLIHWSDGKISQIVFINGGNDFRGEDKLVDLRNLPENAGLPIIEHAVTLLNEHGVTPIVEDQVQIGE